MKEKIMAFPQDQAEMIERGYVAKPNEDGSPSTCGSEKKPGCGETIEWWQTPKGKWLPVNPGSAEAHWNTCSKADDFRGGSSGENVSVLRVNPGEMCRFDKDPAVCIVGMGRDKFKLCGQHSNQLYSLMRAVGEEIAKNPEPLGNDPAGATSTPPDREPGSDDGIPF